MTKDFVVKKFTEKSYFKLSYDRNAKELGEKEKVWTRELLGTDVYHIVSAFIIYSMLGWLVESIYMSFCNKKITNRGFGKGPFCPIYGFGAVIGYFLLKPFSENLVVVYFVGAISATIFEFLVGKFMIKALGELWWDYNEKPCNYKGIICLESTIAWGFYGIIIVTFLHGKVMGFIDTYSFSLGTRACQFILFIVAIDYIIQLYKVLNVQIKEYREKITDKYQSFKARWY